MSEITTIDARPMMIQRPDEESPAKQLMRAIIGGQITSENAAAAYKLYLDMAAADAKKEYAYAFVQLQNELPPISATRVIPDNDGNVRSTFAAIEDILKALKPYTSKHGFSVRFDSESEEGRMIAVCILMHVSGHSEITKASVKTSAPPKSSPAQADGATLTYAKRLALCNAFGISICHDTDARLEGDFISPKDAADLEKEFNLSKGNREFFMKIAGANEFKYIRVGKLSVLRNLIRSKKAATGGAVAQDASKAVDIDGPVAAPVNSSTASSASPSPAGAGSLEDQAHAWATETEISDILKVLTAAKVSTTYSGMIECAMERVKYIHFLPEATREELRRIAYEYKLLLLRSKNV